MASLCPIFKNVFIKRSMLRIADYFGNNRTLSNDTKKDLLSWSPDIPVEKATTPPSSWFCNPEIYSLEKKVVFANSWICVGRKDQVLNTGDYFSGMLADEPYIVVRDGEIIRGFYNVCRHHAAQLTPVCSQGCTKKFVCPYHGWTYALDGRLTKARRLKGIEDFKAKEYGLKPIQVAEMGPLLFINQDVRAEPEEFRRTVEPIHLMLDKTNYGDMEWIKRVEYPMHCNWKVFVDNYLDGGYHVEYLHPSLADNLDIQTYKTTATPAYSVQEVGGKGTDRIGSSAFYIFLYPSLMINKYGPWMDTNMVLPTGENSCKVVYDYYLDRHVMNSMDEQALNSFIEDSLKASDQVQQEDNMICESVQRGLNSSAYTVGRYAPGVEMADHAFHQTLARHLQLACDPLK